MAKFLKVGDVLVNLDTIAAVYLHQGVEAKIDGRYQYVPDGVRIVTTATSSDGSGTLEFAGEDAEAVRRYFENSADVLTV